ncbi:hypothetical protein [Desulfatiglans anilini]|uniref:hypothetical protein n=1 Tax=Desulfatiglans anilini TaxID=90728 RepID=UPI000411493C|nr:hypothetical protein [Desulfatiglans anilini]
MFYRYGHLIGLKIPDRTNQKFIYVKLISGLKFEKDGIKMKYISSILNRKGSQNSRLEKCGDNTR